MSNHARHTIIKALSNGNFVSGQALGEELGMSRAGISKHIKSLSDMGLDIYSVTGKGYRLATPLMLLDEEKIRQGVRSQNLSAPIEVFSTIESTNSYLLTKVVDGLEQGHVCVAESQSAGRGRRGRAWQSPYGSHVYFSMYHFVEQGMQAAMGLNIVAALAITDTLKECLDITAELKWPNDIYIKGEKLAGVLIELEGQALESCHCVIGIGINVNMPAQSAEKIDQSWTDINQHVSVPIDRNVLIATLIDKLQVRLEQHQESGLTDMVDDWHKLDRFSSKPVVLLTGARRTYGVCRGINNQGALMLEVDGTIKPIFGGEVTLRGDFDATY